VRGSCKKHLAALSAGPRRITELADLEGLAQPTMTLVVKRMERRGWLARERDAADGRAVLVSLTDDGATVLDELRADDRAVLRDPRTARPSPPPV
jgi:DNA-binding MarR family transcriptional regulator